VTTLLRLSAALADRYRIERELGQGGMATVYLAEDLKHHRKQLPWGVPVSAIVVVMVIGSPPVAAQYRAEPTELHRIGHDSPDDSLSRLAGAIIAAAIARRHALLATLQDYQYQVAVKLVVRDLDQPQDSASSIAFVKETRSSVSWQAPGHYHETVVARRQVNHLHGVWTPLSINDIGNYQRNRLVAQSQWLVSPIATDALDHYAFRILDTLCIKDHQVIRLAFVPRSETSPGFAGTIDIAASTYDVMAIDAGVNDATRFGLWRKVRYQASFEDTGGGRWMPHLIRLTGEARLAARLPRTPRNVALEQEAQFDRFQLNESGQSGIPNELRVVIERLADRADSAAWSLPGAIPPTATERQVWNRRDSAARRLPGRIGRMGRAFQLSRFSTAGPDFFHFNRVDGAYVGAGSTWRTTPDLTLSTKVGYGTASEQWQYRVGGEYQVSEPRRLWLGLSYHDETVTRPSLLPHSVDRTVEALLYRRDPLDYYRERGLTLSFAIRPVDFTRLELHYNDQEQSSLPAVTDYSLLTPSRAPRSNGSIVNGRMRSLSGSFTYDSRSLLRRNGLDSPLPSLTWTRINVSAEVASPRLIPDDFDFRRYSLQVERHQRTLGMGITTINALVGITTGTVPPQRYFAIDFGLRRLGFQAGGFKTLGDTGFAGNRIAMVSVRHDFDRLLFAKSGLPLIRRSPFTLSVYGAAFAINFVDHTQLSGDSAFRATSGPYSEAGFALGNLVPFLAPLNLGAQFTWQLSRQSTRRFQFGFSLTRQY
jgi:hypothetical protein